jgi:hypothetical protein
LVSNYLQGSSTSVGASVSGAFNISNNNIQSTNITSTDNGGGGGPFIALNSVNGSSDWSFTQGELNSGSGKWYPKVTNSSHGKNNLVSAFTTTIGVSTPTPIVAVPPSILMIYIIKT